MTEPIDIPPDVLEHVRAVCLGLPQVDEEQAWVGTRWRVRAKTFAHVLVVDDGWPPAYAKVAGTDGPVTVLTFRSAGVELEALRGGGPPFFAPPWRPDEVLLVLDDDVDWDEVAELLTESYCTQAPRQLAALVDRPQA